MQTARGASLSDAEPPSSNGVPLPGRRRVGVLALIATTVLALDLATKVTVVARFEGRTPLELAGSLLTLRVIRNPGAAFGLGVGMTIVFSIVAVGVVVTIIRLAPRLRSLTWAMALGLILGGALGNLVDRVFRAPGPLQGHVVDTVSLFAPDGRVWPVFNMADACIVSGGVLLVLLALFGRELDGTRSGGNKAEEPAGE